MRVLVTGGTGYIGAGLVRALLERGDDVVTFGPTSDPGRIADIANDITVIRGNLAYSSEVFNAVKDHRIERIFHLGSMLSQALCWILHSTPKSCFSTLAFDIDYLFESTEKIYRPVDN